MNTRQSLRVETLAGALQMAAACGLPLPQALEGAAEFIESPGIHERILACLLYWIDYLLIWTETLPREPGERPGPHRLLQFFPASTLWWLHQLGLSAMAFQAGLLWAARDVRAGSRLREALKSRIPWLPDDFLQVIEVGEEAGALAELLPLISKRLSTRRGYVHQRNSLIAWVCTYGAIIVTIVSGLMIFIVPKFAKMFDEMLAGEPLPMMTNFVIGVSYFCFRYFWFFSLGAFCLFVTRRLLRRFAQTRRLLGYAICHLPVIGYLPRMGRLHEISTALTACLRRGMGLEAAVELVLMASWDLWSRDFLTRFSDALRAGLPWDQAWRELGQGTPFADWLIANGAYRQDAAGAFEAVARHLQYKMEEHVSLVASLVKPVFDIPAALIVGATVLGLFLPFFKLIDALAT